MKNSRVRLFLSNIDLNFSKNSNTSTYWNNFLYRVESTLRIEFGDDNFSIDFIETSDEGFRANIYCDSIQKFKSIHHTLLANFPGLNLQSHYNFT